jgi:endonuclease/exonuclease/phosphatase family metal-dependent hydrolase
VIQRTIFCAIAPVLAAAAFAAAPSGISVVTLNMAKETDTARIVREFGAVPALRAADVVLLQEVKRERGAASSAEQLAAALGLHVAYSPCTKLAEDQGLAILSRYPLREVRVQRLPAFHLGFHSRERFAIEATADAPHGPVRIFNAHLLPAFHLGFHSRERFAIEATADAPHGPVRIFNAHLDTRLNTRDRLTQLGPVLRDAAAFSGPRVIGGDFNSNGFYWLGHVFPLPGWTSQAAGVYDALLGAGLRTAIPVSATTFDYLGMHLDWIWLGGARPSAYRVYPLRFSDHHAVWTRVEF